MRVRINWRRWFTFVVPASLLAIGLLFVLAKLLGVPDA